MNHRGESIGTGATGAKPIPAVEDTNGKNRAKK